MSEDLEREEEQRRGSLPSAFPTWLLPGNTKKRCAAGTPAKARLLLQRAWIACVQQEGPAELVQTLSAFHAWRSEILNFFAFLPTRLSNGFVEGKNNRTKALMRQTYGYRNHQHLCVLLGVAWWISYQFPPKDGDPTTADAGGTDRKRARMGTCARKVNYTEGRTSW